MASSLGRANFCCSFDPAVGLWEPIFVVEVLLETLGYVIRVTACDILDVYYDVSFFCST